MKILIHRSKHFLLRVFVIYLKFLTVVRWKIRQMYLKLPSKITQRNLSSIVVSIASYQSRYKVLHYTIMNILSQSLRPIRVFVVLDIGQEFTLPISLKKFEKYGVEYIYANNYLRSYKKFFPITVISTKLFATFDDDNFIGRNSLKFLHSQWEKTPNCIIGHRGVRLRKSIDKFEPYTNWKHEFKSGEESHELLLTGGSGILYGISSLKDKIWKPEIFMKISPTADDLWVLFIASALNTKRVLTNPSINRFSLPWNLNEKNNLHYENVAQGGNDLQIKSLFEYFSWPARFPK